MLLNESHSTELPAQLGASLGWGPNSLVQHEQLCFTSINISRVKKAKCELGYFMKTALPTESLKVLGTPRGP
jgi:hypothetical protein